jgi:hypothetical protein
VDEGFAGKDDDGHNSYADIDIEVCRAVDVLHDEFHRLLHSEIEGETLKIR